MFPFAYLNCFDYSRDTSRLQGATEIFIENLAPDIVVRNKDIDTVAYLRIVLGDLLRGESEYCSINEIKIEYTRKIVQYINFVCSS